MELVTCKLVNHHKTELQTCSEQRLTAIPVVHSKPELASLSVGKAIYAAGWRIAAGPGRFNLIMSEKHGLTAGTTR